MPLFATRMSALSAVQQPRPSARMPLLIASVPSHAHPCGLPPTCYDAIPLSRCRQLPSATTTMAPGALEGGDSGTSTNNGGGGGPLSPLSPDDLRRLRRVAWRRRLRGLLPPMSDRLIERVRLVLPHVLLILATALYTVIGAAIMYRIERPHEHRHILSHSHAILEAQDQLVKTSINFSSPSLANESLQIAIDKFIAVSIDAFTEGVKISDLEAVRRNESRPSRWHFHSGLFFTVTVLTSVGYGHLVPISALGRFFCIAYALIGIPLTLITIADLAKFFSDVITDIDIRRRHSSFKNSDKLDTQSVGGLAESSFVAKIFVLFLLLSYMIGAACYFAFATGEWNFVDSIYFCMITLVTIGFGDLVPDDEPHYFGWIVFMFAGLCLTTLAVDMCGSACIDSFHVIGRVNPRALLNAFTQKVYETNSPHWTAYEPTDIRLIPYIDEIIKSYQENNVTNKLSL